MSKRVSVKGMGPELLGRGVDLLFGESPGNEKAANGAASSPGAAAAREPRTTAIPASALGSPDLELDVPPLPPRPSPTEEGGISFDGDADLAAGLPPLTGSEASTVAPPSPPDLDVPPLPDADSGGAAPASPPAIPTLDIPEQEGPPASPGASAPPAEGQAPSHPPSDQPTPGAEAATPVSPAPVSPPTEAPAMPEPAKPTPSNGATAPGAAVATPAPAKPPAEPRKVGAPGAVVSGPVTTVPGSPPERAVPEEEKVLGRPKEPLTEAEAAEILQRVRQRDLEKLDREIDRLYERAVEVLSGEDEASIAFEALRKARHMLLLEPEQVAEIEYLVNQIRAMLTRVEHAQTWGAHYGPRLMGYFLGWLAVLSIFALITIVPNTGFAGWMAYLLRAEPAAAALGVILISTLAWGGIGGATSGLWSLHYHVSVRRDFDKNELLWYLEQPVLGMVLGGIVYLIMAAGFLVVQVDLGSPEATLGAKLLPATLAVVAGFRQNLVLELIDRVVNLLVPRPESPRPRDEGR
ncbi:MAG: hypothetical protein NZ528_05430 [Caldilineales bacterium]|nr:hypothetical protein [Caldilineales bacterium]